MKISSEFSKYAKDYSTYNIIQNKVIKKLLLDLKSRPKNILDLGCGDGALVKAIDWDFESFLGVDFAQGMLDLHPQSNTIKYIQGDFNESELFGTLKHYQFEHIFSSSSLQWATDLGTVFRNIKALKAPISFAIFTSGTFSTLNKTAKLAPLLKSAEEIENIVNKYFKANIELMQYRLEFNSVREMFRYIKKSGVSGGRNILSYKETKKLMKEYPLKYLEFEVIFITAL